MAKKGKHSPAEIAFKLEQANDLATQGKIQSEIARTLGVSVMTLHRWRKSPPQIADAMVGGNGTNSLDQAPDARRIAELELENSRLRRLVTDVLLEKVKIEENFEATSRNSTRQASR
jgi:transposase-like protein